MSAKGALIVCAAADILLYDLPDQLTLYRHGRVHNLGHEFANGTHVHIRALLPQAHNSLEAMLLKVIR